MPYLKYIKYFGEKKATFLKDEVRETLISHRCMRVFLSIVQPTNLCGAKID